MLGCTFKPNLGQSQGSGIWHSGDHSSSISNLGGTFNANENLNLINQQNPVTFNNSQSQKLNLNFDMGNLAEKIVKDILIAKTNPSKDYLLPL